MYNFFFHFIFYSITRALNRILKPKNILFICFILLIIFFAFKNEAHAIYLGNETYTDPNNSTVIAYNSILNDFIIKLDNNKSDSYFEDIIEKLRDSSTGYYIYYGNYNGSSMINSSTYNQSDIYICFYDLTYPSVSATSFDNYLGLSNVDIKSVEVNFTYTIASNGIFTDPDTRNVYIPSPLYNFNADIISNYLLEISNNSSNDVVEAIENQSIYIQQQTNTIQQQNEFLQQQPSSQDFSSSDLPSDNTQDITQDGINNIFTMFYNTFTRQPTSSDYIRIDIPFTNKYFTIPYDYTSTYCPSVLKSIISMFWYFVVSVFVVKDILNKVQKIKTGNMENMQNSNIKGDLL